MRPHGVIALREGVVACLSLGSTTTSWKVPSTPLGAHVTPVMSAGCPGSFSKLCLGSVGGLEVEGIPGEMPLGCFALRNLFPLSHSVTY